MVTIISIHKFVSGDIYFILCYYNGEYYLSGYSKTIFYTSTYHIEIRDDAVYKKQVTDVSPFKNLLKNVNSKIDKIIYRQENSYIIKNIYKHKEKLRMDKISFMLNRLKGN